jgi:transposase InsO family protein
VKQIKQVHHDSRETYGSPRVHAELTLGLGLSVNLKRVARLMREAGIQGLYRRDAAARPVATPPGSPARIWSTATSASGNRTGYGSPTLPSTPPVKGNCTAQRSWTPIPG